MYVYFKHHKLKDFTELITVQLQLKLFTSCYSTIHNSLAIDGLSYWALVLSNIPVM